MKNSKGITLVALVITIVVLLILTRNTDMSKQKGLSHAKMR